MYTYQMIGLADQNGRTYVSEYGSYDKKNGFVLSELGYSIDKTYLINDLFHEDCWSLKKDKPKKMTKEEIEKELGYEIEIDGLKNNYTSLLFDYF